ncbi:peroxisomal carnitine O-octanoyltransferase-like isoform X2 [Homarus americanus]|uniref:peroxisomal carnitine O-octanoyltransferase-like isoform X2 n=1 Tax=Homarus americanus TaxID=6706 RepID=UPI001C4418C3|nr:peroxisomal carnitine O-octanoyltransferase-like isoform X2 [Homarus americanus]
MSVSTEVTPSKEPQHMSVYLTSGKEKTFQYDEDLPCLPVPPLQQTLDRYLLSVKPHATDEEFEMTKEIVKKFESGIGKELHERLLAHAAKKKNWLDDWWLHYAYLIVREPLLPTMNTTGFHPLNFTLWKPSIEKSSEYGSLNLWGFLDFNLALREQRLKPQKSYEGTPFSMRQFRWLFNCTRIPGRGADSLYSTWKTKDEGDCPLHIIFLCHGHIWTMYPWDSAGKPLTPPELEVQLRHIRETSDALGPGPSLSVLTCDTRENWAQNRDWLKSLSVNNMRNLHHIDSSMLVFVLDDTTPENFNQHTPYDAMVSVMLAHYQYLLFKEMNGKWTGPTEVRYFPMPTLLHFDMDAKLVEAISSAKETSLSYINNICAKLFIFADYGKDFLRTHKLHPDAFVQMSIQLAYQRLHGKPAPTYETATTRQFYDGRTETLRSCTVESVDWVQTMLSPKASTSEKFHKMKIAMDTHNCHMKQCQNGEGVDRHLFGLYVVALESGMDIPDLFMDPSYTKSGGGGNYVLSTSTVGYSPVFGGTSAMVPQGYGCFYSMVSDRMNFFLSGFKSSEEINVDAFKNALRASLCDMQNILLVPNSSL